MTQAEILAKRNAFAEKWHNGRDKYGLENCYASASESFIAGFDAAIDLMLKREKVLRDTLKRIRSGLTTQQEKVEFYTKKEAHEALADIEEWK